MIAIYEMDKNIVAQWATIFLSNSKRSPIRRSARDDNGIVFHNVSAGRSEATDGGVAELLLEDL